eukprot:364942-Chlamydomonas_euryale.AAC.8
MREHHAYLQVGAAPHDAPAQQQRHALPVVRPRGAAQRAGDAVAGLPGAPRSAQLLGDLHTQGSHVARMGEHGQCPCSTGQPAHGRVTHCALEGAQRCLRQLTGKGWQQGSVHLLHMALPASKRQKVWASSAHRALGVSSKDYMHEARAAGVQDLRQAPQVAKQLLEMLPTR